MKKLNENIDKENDKMQGINTINRKLLDKKTFLFFLLVLVLCLSIIYGQKASVTFTSPAPATMWVGSGKVSVKIEHIDPREIRLVEFYLDGRLIQEIYSPPYSFTHDFGPDGSNRSLKAVVRGNDLKPIASTENHSLKVDDSQQVEVSRTLIPVVVKDSLGNYVRGLRKEDFIVTVDEKPREITHFSADGTQSFNLIQVIDISYSMRYKIRDVLEASKRFIRGLMTPNDRAAVIYFNHIIFDHTGLTNDINQLEEWLNLKTILTGNTALYDAIASALNITDSTPGWNIIVIFSDGGDNSSYIDRFSLLDIVKKSNALIYAIDNNKARDEKDILQEICTASGGATFPLDNVRKTQQVYQTIRKDIKSQYVLTVDTGSQKGRNRFRKIQIKVKNKPDYEIRTIKGY